MLPSEDSLNAHQSLLFRGICDDLREKSYSVQQEALPEELMKLLCARTHCEDDLDYASAGIGRSIDHHKNQNIRRDEISWIGNDVSTDRKWNAWSEMLRVALNHQLFLGLSPIESHYARFKKGGFYKKHLDAFAGPDNRKVSIVLFLNEFWKAADEGELTLFIGREQKEKVIITPQRGTFVIFLSSEIPHEVLPTNCTRHSIAGWYR